jgi:hypothetical protein
MVYIRVTYRIAEVFVDQEEGELTDAHGDAQAEGPVRKAPRVKRDLSRSKRDLLVLSSFKLPSVSCVSAPSLPSPLTYQWKFFSRHMFQAIGNHT